MSIALAARAAALIGVALVGWSINVKWGSGSATRGGPPLPWERFVVGAAALAALSAVCVWIATRPSATASARRALAGAGCLFSVGIAGVALHLRSEAGKPVLADLVNGPGWAWLTAGAGVSLAAALACLGVGSARPAAAAAATRHKKRR